MPRGTGCVDLHLGQRAQARNSPKRPVLITIGAPHSLQISSEGRSGTLSFLIERESAHSLVEWRTHAMYGPKRPLFTSSGLPHLGHFSVSRPDRSWTS